MVMKTTGAAVLGVSALMVATAVCARAQSPPTPSISHAVTGSSVAPGIEGSAPQSRPLFTIAGVGVSVWAPVEPIYDGNANRNLAADPLWEAVPPPAPPGF